MSQRTVFALQSGKGRSAYVSIRRAPSVIPDADRLGVFECPVEMMPPWGTPSAVKAHGTTIWSKLTSHPPVEAALQKALDVANGTNPIYFLVNAEEAERLAWESLCDTKGTFLALDQRWPIGRIAESLVDRPSAPHEFGPPLRVLAALSALQVDATVQWRKLRDSARKAVDAGLPVNLLVLVGQEELQEAIQQEIDTRTLAMDVRVRAMPLDLVGFEGQLKEFRPHLLHFFCHGKAEFGNAELHLGTINDWTQKASVASLRLPLEKLRFFPSLQRVWLVVLNCCSSAQPAGELHSLAHNLVAGGVPAAVGMVEPVGAADADDFTETFYEGVFDILAQAFKALPGTRIEVDWSAAMWRPRDRLARGKADDVRQWLVPALYTQMEPFHVILTDGRGPRPGPPPPPVAPPAAGAPPGPEPMMPAPEGAAGEIEEAVLRRLRSETVAGMLRSLPPETPVETRAEILKLLDDLPAELRPDEEGLFDRER